MRQRWLMKWSKAEAHYTLSKTISEASCQFTCMIFGSFWRPQGSPNLSNIEEKSLSKTWFFRSWFWSRFFMALPQKKYRFFLRFFPKSTTMVLCCLKESGAAPKRHEEDCSLRKRTSPSSSLVGRPLCCCYERLNTLQSWIDVSSVYTQVDSCCLKQISNFVYREDHVTQTLSNPEERKTKPRPPFEVTR